jgi:hypothetical protein
MTSSYELAQVNIGRMLAPIDSETMRDFVDNLDAVNAAAEAAEGFVWRLKDDVRGNATSYHVFGDEWLIVNMSVWTSPEALNAYVYGPTHLPVLRRRREWFHRMAEAYSAMWWVPAGHRPTIQEAEKRLIVLREKGPTPEAFTMREQFEKPKA